jgi:hypothetical protein
VLNNHSKLIVVLPEALPLSRQQQGPCKAVACYGSICPLASPGLNLNLTARRVPSAQVCSAVRVTFCEHVSRILSRICHTNLYKHGPCSALLPQEGLRQLSKLLRNQPLAPIDTAEALVYPRTRPLLARQRTILAHQRPLNHSSHILSLRALPFAGMPAY